MVTVEDKKKPVDVTINGTKISVVSDEDELYVQQIADYINRKSDEINGHRSGVSISSQLMKILVSVNITDDLFKERIKVKELEKEVESYIYELGKIQEENILLREKIDELQMSLNKTEKELQFYVDIFEK